MSASVYHCGGCTETFDNRDDALLHVKQHSYAEQRIKCRMCNKVIKAHGLKKHELIHSTTRKKYPCQNCSKTYLTKYDVEQHMLRHTGEHMKTCPICHEKVGYLAQHMSVHMKKKMTVLQKHEKKHIREDHKTCVICGKQNASIRALKAHLLTHVQNKRDSVCPVCHKSYRALKQHILSIHLEPKKQQCPVCKGEFRALGSHMKTHEVDGRRISCDECPATFLSRFTLRRHKLIHSAHQAKQKCQKCGKLVMSLSLHLRTVHGDQSKPIKCPKCNKHFKLPASLKSHLRTHGNAAKKRCPKCNKDIYYTHLKEHMKIHLPITSRHHFVCPDCEQTFITKIGLRQHITIQHTDHPMYPCSKCNSTFNKKSYLNNHIKRIHEERLQTPCPLCAKIYTGPKNLQRHMKAIHNEDRKSFSCEICSKRFAARSSVKIHMLAVHKGETIKETCPICKGEYNKFTIKIHMKVHSDRPKVHCVTCKKEFIGQEALNRHIARHKGLQRKVCPICNKNVADLSGHMIIHSNEKKFTCATCNQAFKRKYSYKMHLSTHLPLSDRKTIACPKCDELFTTRGHLKRHLKRHSLVYHNTNPKLGKRVKNL